jgi:drug/metabolite transporter (DMT)-like permease
VTAGIAYALGAMLFFGLGDLLYKRGAAAGASAHQFLMVQTWVFLPAVVLYGLATGSLVFAAGSLWGALAGFFAYTGFYNFAYSLRHGSISVNAPVFRLSFVITAVLAVLLLAEPVTVWKAAGIALALVAVWLLLAAPAAQVDAARRSTRESLLRVLVATAAVGVANFLYKLGVLAGATPASLVVTQACVAVPLASAFAAALDGGVRPARVALRHAPLAALALALAFAFLVESLQRGEASVVVPIAQMGFVVTALAGFVLLGERFTARKGVGLLAALAALASLAHG